ncbi:flagella basal body P-ring formation protein FlgA [Alishewanella longhuensis]|uniref:Flagella basal body P-ring formation protein FlgA n=1 Tax=Alishewanella longhuensis TaxID=1091037 RepID=A0ABQ3KZA3_9ALTE|nr:flagellar basal body P-ring formation chaperone FlgA [Alishewanella longhuensis]GHG69143.1 flagella basal body P-ring formation protein FlgA [Alishewanella longhuensis]
MKKYENFILYLILTVYLWLSYPLFAVPQTSQWYSPEQLTEMARDWLTEELLALNTDAELHVTALDNRLGSKECTAALNFTLPAGYNPRQTTVQISCSGPTPWQLFLPVRLTEWLELVVIKQNITPGTVITADMLELQRRERRLVRGTIIQDPTMVLGSRNKRSFSVGQIISLQDLCLVCRGDIVTIQVSNNGLSVTATGIAQQDGTLGDAITVRNQQSGRNIQTEVVGVNQVKVKF